MFLVAVLLALYSLPHTRSVKVVIDGTIDFGPNWNFEYKVKPVGGFDPRKTISNMVRNNNHDNNVKESERARPATTTESVDESDANIGTLSGESLESSVNAETAFGKTMLYPKHTKRYALFKRPRAIKNEKEVSEFMDHIKNKTLATLHRIRDRLDGKLAEKINKLIQRYEKEFSEFENNTNNIEIWTANGNNSVVMNTIDYSNRLVNRLGNRFKIDTEDLGLKNGKEASKIFQKHTEKLKIATHEEACRMFDICRAGKEFLDHISELMEILLEQDDNRVRLAVITTARQLKSADWSPIMDDETNKAFSGGLSALEEMEPFEIRVLLLLFKSLVDSRHQPFVVDDKGDPNVKAMVALSHAMDVLNKEIVVDEAVWKEILADFRRWLASEDQNVKDVIHKLVNHVQTKLDQLDAKTSTDFKEKLKFDAITNSLRMRLRSILQIRPFVL